MRIAVTCPFCDKKGTLPEAMRGQRIRCAGCHQPFVVSAPKTVAKPSAGLLAAIPEEDHGAYTVQPLRRRSTHQAPHPARSSSAPPPVYVGLGIGAVCGLVVTGVTIVMLSKGPDKLQREVEPAALVKPVDPVEPTQSFSAPKPQSPPVVTESERATAAAQRKKAVEDATVYLKLSSGGRLMGSGTGFVIRAERGEVLLATNRHVADAATDDGGKAAITAVFRSGQGPNLEQSLPAEIVAIDFSREMNHDLAILRVRGLTRGVVPIDQMVRTVPSLQMKYSVYGFPYADLINLNKGNPDITVTGGTVSSLMKDEHGQLVSLKLDGALHPGNSGGPLVDDQGRLIGVVVAKVSGVDNIGLAIPASDLREVLAGRVGAMDLIISKSNTPQPDLHVKAQLVDPNGRIKQVKLLVAPTQAVANLAPGTDGRWPALPGANSR